MQFLEVITAVVISVAGALIGFAIFVRVQLARLSEKQKRTDADISELKPKAERVLFVEQELKNLKEVLVARVEKVEFETAQINKHIQVIAEMEIKNTASLESMKETINFIKDTIKK